MEGHIKAEWEKLRRVVIHRPGIEMFFGLLDPEASLYERAFSQSNALKEHDKLVSTLQSEFGVSVDGFCEAISRYACRDKKAKEILVETAIEHVEFIGNKKEVALAKKEMALNVDTYDLDYFVNIILLRPRIALKKNKNGAEAIHIDITARDPLVNLYFMHDQQAVTDRGIFLSRMSKPQRRHEPAFAGMLWKMMKLDVVHKCEAPGTFEGGDFMPMKEFALIGCGDRTNARGAEQMLKHGQSFPEVGIVHQPTHPLMPGGKSDPMINMHLDTYFNVAGSNIAIGSELLLKRAAVDVYVKDGNSYKKDKKRTNLFDYIRGKGFSIINLSTLEQMSYASNFLCIKDHTILAVESESIVKSVLRNLEFKARLDKKRYGALLSQAKKDYNAFLRSEQMFPHKKEIGQNGIDFYAIDLKNVTGGYGGAHCMTAAIERN